MTAGRIGAMGESLATVIHRARRYSEKLSRRTIIIASLVAVALVVGGSYGGWRLYQRFHVDQVEILNAVQLNATVDGQKVTVITSHLVPTGPRPLALVTHGYRADQRVTRQPYMAKFTQDLVNAGWIVAASNAHGDAWGGEESAEDYKALYAHISKEYKIAETVVVSLSMGAISGLELVEEKSIPNIAGWVGVSPVTDLPAMAATDDWREVIHSKLDDAEIAELDPMRRSLGSVPLTVYTSPTDKITPTPVHAEPFAKKHKARVVTCTGGHVAPDCFRAEDVISLAD